MGAKVGSKREERDWAEVVELHRTGLLPLLHSPPPPLRRLQRAYRNQPRGWLTSQIKLRAAQEEELERIARAAAQKRRKALADRAKMKTTAARDRELAATRLTTVQVAKQLDVRPIRVVIALANHPEIPREVDSRGRSYVTQAALDQIREALHAPSANDGK